MQITPNHMNTKMVRRVNVSGKLSGRRSGCKTTYIMKELRSSNQSLFIICMKCFNVLAAGGMRCDAMD